MRFSSHSRAFVLLALCAAASASGATASGQTGQWATEPSSLCGRDHALALVRQQLDAAKAFGVAARRVAVMIRAFRLQRAAEQEKLEKSKKKTRP
jgi:hypothetical protein